MCGPEDKVSCGHTNARRPESQATSLDRPTNDRPTRTASASNNSQQDRDILEYDDDFIAALKNYKPDIGKEELQDSIMQFRVYVREKRGLC